MNKETLIRQLEEVSYKTDQGLSEDMFLFASTITPLINVDLFVTDDERRVLLAWRDDSLCGRGWHIPGGIIRHRESIHDRVIKTALNELGCAVETSDHFIKTSEIFLEQEERNHFISLLLECAVPDSFSLDEANKGKDENTLGYLRWFEKYPDTGLVYSQYVYNDFLRDWFRRNHAE